MFNRPLHLAQVWGPFFLRRVYQHCLHWLTRHRQTGSALMLTYGTDDMNHDDIALDFEVMKQGGLSPSQTAAFTAQGQEVRP